MSTISAADCRNKPHGKAGQAFRTPGKQIAICGIYLFPMYLVGHWCVKSMICLDAAIFAIAAFAFIWYPNLPASGETESQLGQKTKEMTAE
jgi:hypothetical protein